MTVPNLATICEACFQDWHESCTGRPVLETCCCGYEDLLDDEDDEDDLW